MNVTLHRLKQFEEILKKHDQKLSFYFSPTKQIPLDSIDPRELLETALKWGELSAQGLVCGILGCGAEPDKICSVCDSHYCSEHIPWHFHSATNTGILEKDSSEMKSGMK